MSITALPAKIRARPGYTYEVTVANRVTKVAIHRDDFGYVATATFPRDAVVEFTDPDGDEFFVLDHDYGPADDHFLLGPTSYGRWDVIAGADDLA